MRSHAGLDPFLPQRPRMHQIRRQLEDLSKNSASSLFILLIIIIVLAYFGRSAAADAILPHQRVGGHTFVVE